MRSLQNISISIFKILLATRCCIENSPSAINVSLYFPLSVKNQILFLNLTRLDQYNHKDSVWKAP